MIKYINNDYFKFLCIAAFVFIIYFLNPVNIFVVGNELSFVAVIINQSV